MSSSIISAGGHEGIDALLLGLPVDPFVVTVIVGIVWPLIQASLDRPWWTPRRRVTLVAIAALLLSFGIWMVGVYPMAWQMIVTQASMILGIAWSTYQVLSRVRIGNHNILEWAGILTPGGETYIPRHRREE